MKTTKIKLGDKHYTVEIAISDDERKQGLQERESLEKDSGMLFDFGIPELVSMWMKNTKVPLKQCFINEDQEVTKVVKRTPMDESLVSVPNTLYVLEVDPDEDIKEGDVLDFEDDDEKVPQMKVLAPDGSTQMELEGGERIVSRRETKILIKKAKQAYDLRKTDKYDNACKSLGKYMFKVLKGQDTREPEYVDAPK